MLDLGAIFFTILVENFIDMHLGFFNIYGGKKIGFNILSGQFYIGTVLGSKPQTQGL